MVVAEAASAALDARVAVVAGATGLVGRAVLAALLADNYTSAVHSLGRRTLPLTHTKLTQHIVDFAALPELSHIDDVFICLGTTIKVAGSQAAFRAVDYDAVMAVAQMGRAQGATKLGVVSAMGADAKSGVFYNRVKGDVEDAIAQLGYTSVSIVRPSLLVGDRGPLNQPERSGERIGLVVSKLLKPLIPANYLPVQAEDVAAGLVQAVKAGKPGVQRILSGALQGAAARAAAA
ncbi:nucleoside-diphosphate sugar epimerase [Rhodoferax mekongensis]|uniref:Nucleoside-diphosphate sugar epimerase n=1 Tax=Rhodoferax mekongensis TaxID=3068341 RepID=A0ABZ0B503_9BURK|nr:nucleoside-diphosphate sugar epimerase [Rhodoferax sp. TBRC 17307]WNO06755.1 nucleoside-diphosphate sugar epimerase [Rhodoferax sp. TBRC 17307]